MASEEKDLAFAGALAFGALIGWVTSGCYVGLTVVDLTWLGSLIAIIGGAGITALFKERTLFAGYCIGLLMFFPGEFFQGAAGRAIAVKMGWSVSQPAETKSEINPPSAH